MVRQNFAAGQTLEARFINDPSANSTITNSTIYIPRQTRGNAQLNQCKPTEDLNRRNPWSKCHFCQKMSHDSNTFTTTDIFPNANEPLTNVSVTALTGDPQSLGNITACDPLNSTIACDPVGQSRVFIFDSFF